MPETVTHPAATAGDLMHALAGAVRGVHVADLAFMRGTPARFTPREALARVRTLEGLLAAARPGSPQEAMAMLAVGASQLELLRDQLHWGDPAAGVTAEAAATLIGAALPVLLSLVADDAAGTLADLRAYYLAPAAPDDGLAAAA
jgi:hypothetical protein